MEVLEQVRDRGVCGLPIPRVSRYPVRLAQDGRQRGVEVQQLLVVRLAPLASFRISEETPVHTVVEGPENPGEALLDGDEIAVVPRGLVQLEQVRQQPRLGMLVSGPEPAVDRVQVLGDEAHHSFAEPPIRLQGHRRRVRGGDRTRVRRQGWRRDDAPHDAQEVLFLEHARERLPDPAVGTEEDDHRQPSDILAHEIRTPVVVDEDAQVVLVQVFRHLDIGKHLLFEVLAPVTPDGADQEEDGFAFPPRGVECRRGMLREPYLRRVMGVAPGVRGGEDCDHAESENREEPP